MGWVMRNPALWLYQVLSRVQSERVWAVGCGTELIPGGLSAASWEETHTHTPHPHTPPMHSLFSTHCCATLPCCGVTTPPLSDMGGVVLPTFGCLVDLGQQVPLESAGNMGIPVVPVRESPGLGGSQCSQFKQPDLGGALCLGDPSGPSWGCPALLRVPVGGGVVGASSSRMIPVPPV